MSGLNHVQYGDHYPLVDPSPDIQGLIVDMTVSYTNNSWEYNLPLRISSLNVNNKGIVLKDARGNTVFDSNGGESVTSFSAPVFDRFTIVTWIAETAVVKVIVRNDKIPSTELRPEEATLDLRAVCPAPKHVTSINGQKGAIVLEAGNNMEMSGTANVISMDAIAGAGTGKNPCEEEDITETFTVAGINGAAPDKSGNVFIEPEDGYLISTDCNTIHIRNTNTPCCECEELKEFANYTYGVSNKYQEIGGKVKWIFETHEMHVDYWNTKPVCAPVDPLAVYMISQSCGYVNFFAIFKNISENCMLPVKVRGHFTPECELLAYMKTHKAPRTSTSIVLVDGKEAEVENTYFETITKYVRYEEPILFEEVEWNMVEPGDIFWYSAYLRIKPDESGKDLPAKEIGMRFDIEYVETDNNIRSVYNNGEPYNVKTLRNGQWRHHHYGVHPYHKGVYEPFRFSTNCADTGDDAPANKNLANKIKKEIYDIKKKKWPCPKDEE